MMKQIFSRAALRSLVTACAVSATALSPIVTAPAAADGWGRPESSRQYQRYSDDCTYRGDRPGCNLGNDRKLRGYYGSRNYYHRPRHHHDGDAAAAAIIGLAGVAIIAGALSQANRAPAPRTYRIEPDRYPPAPARSGPNVITYDSTLEPWTPEWYDWCDRHYRSFNGQTGTFRGYDGRDHFCVPR